MTTELTVRKAEDRQPSGKKVYTTPILTAYGDVRKITEALGRTGKFDGRGFKRTGP
jgi:hypothetical protein